MANRNYRRRNASAVRLSVFERDSELRRLPASAVELTAEERRFLKDPNWIDEDEADALLAMRREKEEGRRAIPFRKLLKELGYDVAD